jgi:tetratricopeptide (TPR) repeat protein
MINPAKLSADRRDSVCNSCHLAGEVRVLGKGRDWQSYHPGGRLADSMTVFVQADPPAGLTVTSHAEKLAQSACQRASGERMWCGSCHDPHKVPAAAERAAWFRGKCLTCHETKPCRENAATRAKKSDDCTACHMPQNPASDAEHVVYTDHSIPRRARPPLQANRGADLVAFGGGRASARDTALAYAITGRTARAVPLLEEVERGAPDDVEVLLYLAEAYRAGGDWERAIPLYERAIRLDPNQVTASAGLGSIRMERGEITEAIRLWQDALAKNAGLELVRTNLAQAQWRAGDLRAAEATLLRAIEINPGFAPPFNLLGALRRAR